jgi:hypothetical protein
MRRLILAGSLALTACAGGTVEPDPSFPELRSAPTSLSVDGQDVRVSIEIWRDLMPRIGPGGGSPLAVFATFAPRAPALTVTEVHLLLGDQHWSGSASQLGDPKSWAALGGPEWPVGSTVTVVLLLRIPGQGAARLRVPDVAIKGAY